MRTGFFPIRRCLSRLVCAKMHREPYMDAAAANLDVARNYLKTIEERRIPEKLCGFFRSARGHRNDAQSPCP
jgi:hypothetical protein